MNPVENKEPEENVNAVENVETPEENN